jgi:hypothetical protein
MAIRLLFLVGLMAWCLGEETPAITPAELEQEAAALRLRLPDHNVMVVSPFVLITDLEADDRTRAVRTVRWAANLLQQDFFTKPPDGTPGPSSCAPVRALGSLSFSE